MSVIPGGLQRHDRNQSDAACSEHDRRVPHVDARPDDRVHADRERLHQGAFHRRHVVRELEAELRGMRDVLPHRALRARGRKELHLLAEVVFALFAPLAFAAEGPRLHTDPVPDLEILDAVGHFHHRAANSCPMMKG